MTCTNFPKDNLIPNVTQHQVGNVTYLYKGGAPTAPLWEAITPPITIDARGVANVKGGSAQDFIDSFALKILQSPTNGGLTKIQTRTVDAGEVYEVRKTSDDSLATIYSNAKGTTEIVQNGTSNVSGSAGVVEFYIDAGYYYVEVDGVKSNFTDVVKATNVKTSDGRNVQERLDDLPSEVDAAGTAATLISQHNSDAAAHPEMSAFITSEANRAETAADAASISGNVFPSVTGSGGGIESGLKYFSVVSPDSDGYLDLYENVSGTAIFKKTYPSSSFLTNELDLKNKTNAISGYSIGQIIDNVSSTENLFGSDYAEVGYLPVTKPWDGSLTSEGGDAGLTITSNYLYVGDIPVGGFIYVNGLGDNSYGRGYAHYDKNKISVGGAIRPANQTQTTVPARPSEDVVWLRFTVKTTKPDDNTDVNKIVIRKSGYATEYIEYKNKVMFIFNSPIHSDITNIEPESETSPTSLSYVSTNYAKLSANPYNLINTNKTSLGHMPVTAPFDGKLVSDAGYISSDFFDISDLELTDSLFFSGFYKGYVRYIYFYDADKNTVTDINGDAYKRKLPIYLEGGEFRLTNFRPKSSAIYARMTLVTAKQDDTTDIELIQVTKYSKLGYVSGDYVRDADIVTKTASKPKDAVNLETAKSLLGGYKTHKNKILTVLGDSISDPAVTHNWPNVISDMIGGATIENVAKSGAHWEEFGTTPDDPRWFTTQVDSILSTGSDPDVIFIAMGTNSVYALFGKFDTTVSDPFESINLKSVYGAMRYGLEKFRIRWPKVPIFMSTPLQRASRSQYDEFTIKMEDGIRKMAEWYSCIVVEAGKEAGIVHQIEKDANVLLYDGLHPNEVGSALQAAYFSSKIKPLLDSL